MGYPTKVQAIKRGKGSQWVVNFPAALASAMELIKSEVVEWKIIDRNKLELVRRPKGKKRRSGP